MRLGPFFSGCVQRPSSQSTNKPDSSKITKTLIAEKVERKVESDQLIDNKEKFESPDSTKMSRKYQAYQSTKSQHLQTNPDDEIYPSKLLESTDGSINDEDFETSEEFIKAKVIAQSEWLKILKNNDIDNTSHAEIVESLRYGIPDELRPQIWNYLTKLDKLKKQHSPTLYTKLKTCPSNWDDQIKRDIGRTFSDHPFFQQEKGKNMLFNILRAYSSYDNEIGYTQGMNFIVGALLIILNPENYKESKMEYFRDYEEVFEEDAFWLFIHISFVMNYRTVFKKDFPKLHGMIKNLENRIKVKAPEIDKHIKANDFEAFLCFHQLFLSLLLVQTPIPIAKRIFDMFFIEEEKVLFKILIRAVTLCKREILELNEERLRNFFDQKMMQLCYQKYHNKLYLLFPSSESAE